MAPAPRASRFSYLVESGPASVGDLAARALARHQHAVVIVRRRRYYLNPDLRQYPVPRHGRPQQVPATAGPSRSPPRPAPAGPRHGRPQQALPDNDHQHW